MRSTAVLAGVFIIGAVNLDADRARAATVFESGTLGPTGISFADIENLTVPGTFMPSRDLRGVRFELTQPVVTSQVGGHFAGQSGGTFFGAIVKLDGQNDFPNSTTLFTPDVLGLTMLEFPSTSADVYGNLTLSLEPGWYALVFGSGLFGASGFGASVRNGSDIGDPEYIFYPSKLAWLDLDDVTTSPINHRFVVNGSVVPEPNALVIALLVLAFCFSARWYPKAMR